MILESNQNIKISKKQINEKLKLSNFQSSILKDIDSIKIVSIVNNKTLLFNEVTSFSQIVELEIITKDMIQKSKYKTVYKIIDLLFENTLLIICLKNEGEVLCTDLESKISKYRSFKFHDKIIVSKKVDNIKQFYDVIMTKLIEIENLEKEKYSNDVLKNDKILRKILQIEKDIERIAIDIRKETNMQKKIEFKEQKNKLKIKLNEYEKLKENNE